MVQENILKLSESHKNASLILHTLVNLQDGEFDLRELPESLLLAIPENPIAKNKTKTHERTTILNLSPQSHACTENKQNGEIELKHESTPAHLLC